MCTPFIPTWQTWQFTVQNVSPRSCSQYNCPLAHEASDDMDDMDDMSDVVGSQQKIGSARISSSCASISSAILASRVACACACACARARARARAPASWGARAGYNLASHGKQSIVMTTGAAIYIPSPHSSSKDSGIPSFRWTTSMLNGGFPFTSYMAWSSNTDTTLNGSVHGVPLTMCGCSNACTYAVNGLVRCRRLRFVVVVPDRPRRSLRISYCVPSIGRSAHI